MIYHQQDGLDKWYSYAVDGSIESIIFFTQTQTVRWSLSLTPISITLEDLLHIALTSGINFEISMTHGTQHYWYQSWITLSPSFDTITSSYQSYTAVCRDDFYAVSPKHQVLFEDTQADKIIHQHAFYQTSQQQPSVDVAFRSGSTSIIYAQQHDYLECYQRIDSDHNNTRQIHSSLSLVPLPSDKHHAMLYCYCYYVWSY